MVSRDGAVCAEQRMNRSDLALANSVTFDEFNPT